MIPLGDQAANDKKAGDIAKIVSEILGGAGGGNQRFAQGGGKDKSKKNDAIKNLEILLGVKTLMVFILLA